MKYLNVKSDATVWFRRRLHQLADSFENRGDFFVALMNVVFKLDELEHKFLVRSEKFAQFNKRAYDFDICLYCDWTVQDAGQHYRAVFGENVGPVAASAIAMT
jgi:hypothetical protein